MTTLLIVLWVLGGLLSAWMTYEIFRLKKDVRQIMQVLAQASPELARRIEENGTAVVFREKWEDDREYVDVENL